VPADQDSSLRLARPSDREFDDKHRTRRVVVLDPHRATVAVDKRIDEIQPDPGAIAL
jgi:hypothetical protein